MKRGNLHISPKSWEIIMESIISEETTENDKSLSNNDNPKLIQNFYMIGLDKIGNVGKSAAEKAASFITDLTSKPVEIGVVSVVITTLEEVKKELKDEYKIFTGISFSGDISGVGVLIFSEKSALTLSKTMLAEMMGMEDDGDELDDMKISAINETCNLIISAYVDTLANSISASLSMSPPFLNKGIEKEIIENLFGEYNITNPKDIILTFKSKLHSQGIGSGFEVLMIMPPESINLLFQKL